MLVPMCVSGSRACYARYRCAAPNPPMAGLGAETKQAHGPAARAWDGFPQAAQRLASRAPDRALLLRDDAREGAGPGLWPPPGTSKRHHPAMAETAVWSVPSD